MKYADCKTDMTMTANTLPVYSVRQASALLIEAALAISIRYAGINLGIDAMICN